MTSISRLLDNKRISWALIYFIVIGMITINVVLALKTIDELAKTQKNLTNTGEVILALDKLHILVLSAETGQRGYLLTENKDYLAPYQEALSLVLSQIQKVKALQTDMVADLDKQQVLLELVATKLDELTYTVELALNDKEKRAIRTVMTGRGKNLYNEIKTYFDELQNAEVKHRYNLYKKLNKIEKEAQVTFSISAITSFLLLFGLWFLVRINNKTEQQYKDTLEQQNEKLADEVKERTKELTLYSEELSRSNRELEDFAFVASHDLQEPLRKIRAFGDRLMTTYATEIDPKGQDYLQRMYNAAERMSNLINDLLEYSRINTRGKQFVSVALDEVLEAVLDDLEVAIEESKAEIIVTALPVINGDKSQLDQLFLNLLSNAIKFKKEAVSPHINIDYKETMVFDPQLETDSLWYEITVKDNGIGFSQEFEDKIFIPFQRLHARSQYKGTGIGLAVCRRIVERHGGIISVQSEVNVGSEFTIKIPHDFTFTTTS
ncbi:ATP-binding protein [Psychromonas sp. SR45-3]|uniref:sensor histidine kinase n=1 Tax=Psychromonas sp. SR45-3 TaxID=2760930 RepID=UPI0015FB7DC1|nr:sensor histidine kinase [Psychromonas sp. SR45-3]MBB1274875.1 CHASE3 domain-containing protein [Psychromonas sp. SR45-3]